MNRGVSANSGVGIAFGGGLISAVLLWFAYPPISIFPVALFAYAPLLNRCPDLEPRARFLVGWVHGACLQAALFYWLPDGLKEARGAQTTEAFQIFGNFIAYQGLFSGLYMWLLGFIGWKNSPLPFALGAAALFALLESLFPFLIPLPYGGVVYKVPLLCQSFELGGATILSFILVFSSALLARSVSPHGTGKTGELRGWAVIIVVLSVGIALYGSWRLSAVGSEDAGADVEVGKSMSLGVVQPNLPVALDRQNDISSRAAILDLTLGVEDDLPSGSSVVIWPEGAFPFFYMPREREDVPAGRSSYSHRYTRRLLKHVNARDHSLIMGALHDAGQGRIENGVFAVAPDGSHQRYLKRWPLPWIEGGSVGSHLFGTTIEPLLLGSGPEDDIFLVDGVRVLPTLYQELGYGLDLYRRAAKSKPDLIVNLADDRWFGASSASELQVMNQVIRAVELRVPVVRVAYGGVSVLVDEVGEILQRTGLLVQTAERWDLSRSVHGRSMSFGPKVVLLGLFLLLALCVFSGQLARRRKGQKSRARRK